MSEETRFLIIDDLTVALTKKRIRHLYIRVSMKDASVHISAPARMPLSEIKEAVRTRRAWIEHQRQRALTSPSTMTRDLPADAGTILKKRLLPLIPECEAVVGQAAAGYRLKDMSTRWGSCSLKTHLISLNLRLYDRDDDCLKYVVIHELCHFYVSNHGPAFYHCMDQFYPDWRTARCKLRTCH